MTEPAGPVCDIPAPHEGPVRLYPAGWLCSAHSPWRALGLPEPPPAYQPHPQQEEDPR